MGEALTEFDDTQRSEYARLRTVIQKIESSGGSHPDLAAHDAMGLATDSELTAHTGGLDPHVQYALDADLANHEADTTNIHGIVDTSVLGPHPSLASHDSMGLATDAELAAHVAAADPHTGYRLESADHDHSSFGLQGGTVLHSSLGSVTADQHHAQLHAAAHAPGGGDAMAVDAVAGTGSLRTLGTGAQQAAAGNHSHGGGSEAFPVGAVFIAVVATNPATLLGYGTWSAFGAGRVLVGLDATDADFDLVEETGGAKTKAISAHAGTAVANHVVTQPNAHTDVTNHTHTVSHSHTQRGGTATTGGLSGATWDTSTSGGPSNWGYSTTTDAPTSSGPSGGVASQSHAGTAVDAHGVTQPSAHTDLNVVQPYIVVYMWKRTA